MNKWHLVVALFLAVGVTAQAMGNPLVFELIDQHGKPLKNAVVELETGTDQAPVSSSTLVMDQVDKAFLPKVLVITRGQYVDFPNSDNIRHHVYSFSKAKTFELKLYSGKPEAPVRFENAGLVVLGCNIHDSMVGYIYVSDSAYAKVSDKSGLIQFEQIPAGVTTLTVWHPDASDGPDQRMLINIDPSIMSGGNQVIKISTVEPAPRNTFEDLFRNAE